MVTAVFDNDPARIGDRLGDVIVRGMDELERTIKEQSISIGVVAVPPSAAQ